jgi:hypothetical protein
VVGLGIGKNLIHMVGGEFFLRFGGKFTPHSLRLLFLPKPSSDGPFSKQKERMLWESPATPKMHPLPLRDGDTPS